MTTLTLTKAIELRDALDRSIAMMQSGELSHEDLRRNVLNPSDVWVSVPACTPPSPEVLAAVGNSQAARNVYVAQTETRRAAALTLNIAAQLAGMLAPLAGQLLKRGAGLALLLCLSPVLAACTGRIGPENEPLVAVGSEVDLDAAVSVAGVSAPISGTGVADLSGIGTDTTEQTVSQTHTSWAGGDSRPVSTVLNLDGSGWPVALVAACAVLGFVGMAYLRQRRHYATLERNAQGVAQAVQELGPSTTRDRLLTLIRARVDDQTAWTKTLGPRDVSHETKIA